MDSDLDEYEYWSRPIRPKNPYDPSLQRYIRKPQSSEPGHVLCELCNTIDFRAIFLTDPRTIDGSEPVVLLAPVGNMHPNHCRLCTIFVEYARHPKTHASKSDKDLNPTSTVMKHVAGLATTPKEQGAKHLGLHLRLHGDSTGLCLASSDRYCLSPHFEWTPMAGFGHSSEWPNLSTIQANVIDFEWLTLQVQSCRLGKSNLLSQSHIPNLKLIDCHDHRVVTVDGPCSYLALSYVWGEHKRVKAYEQHIFPEEGVHGIAEVILDAMEVTRTLGKRYLWVDRYCINHQAASNAWEQLQAMGEIFASAFATIVALGPDDTSNLPGVRVRRREPTYVQTLQGRLHPISQSSLWDEIKSSTWMSRAWTFQEACLSKRLIIFEGPSVLLVTNTDKVSDALYPEYRMQVRVSYSKKISHFTSGFNPWAWTFEEAVQEYSRRALTFEDDAMHAFRGYLKTAEITTYWAIPFWDAAYCKPSDDRELAFVKGLWWNVISVQDNLLLRDSNRDLYSDRGLPSWSWIAGRRNAVWVHSPDYPDSLSKRFTKLLDHHSYDLEYLSGFKSYSEGCLCDVSIEHSDGSLVRAGTYFEKFEHDTVIPEQTRYLSIDAFQSQLHLSAKRDQPVLSFEGSIPDSIDGFSLHIVHDFEPDLEARDHLSTCQRKHSAILLIFAGRSEEEIMCLRWLAVCLLDKHAHRIGAITTSLLYKPPAWAYKKSASGFIPRYKIKRRVGEAHLDSKRCFKMWHDYATKHKSRIRLG